MYIKSDELGNVLFLMNMQHLKNEFQDDKLINDSEKWSFKRIMNRSQIKYISSN